MMHKPIQFKNLSFSLPHKLCFEQFTATISFGQRIAIIGQNGSGKSTLLRLIQNLIKPTEGELVIPHDLVVGYVPQLIEEFEGLSGGQRFHEKLTQALALQPNLLLLDEPTNHLDGRNRQSLMRMLRSFERTVMVVTHDVELLNQNFDALWHIDHGCIRVFKGSYDDYQRELVIQYQSIEQELSALSRQKMDAHKSLMKEQVRAKNSRKGGMKKIENKKWPTVHSPTKTGRANETSDRKKRDISYKKQALTERISALRLPEALKPTFSIPTGKGSRVLISISDGSVGFESPIVTAINLSITTGQKIAISGANGSGKSTLIRAILGDPVIAKTGSWQVVRQECIGYLDQHYSTLDVLKTVFDTIQTHTSNWSHAEVRRHLNDFLFRKNEEINAPISSLSGGKRHACP